MRISRLASRWTFSCAILGLLVLPASDGDAAPTAEQRRDDRVRASARATRAAEGSRGLVLAAAMTDRLRLHDAFGGPERGLGAGWGRPDHEALHPASRARGRHERMGLGDFPAKREHERDGFPSAPIPEPSSVVLFAAGAGVVALIARRKLF